MVLSKFQLMGLLVVSKCQRTSRWWPFPCVYFNVRQFHAPLSEPQASTPRQKSDRKPMSYVVLHEISVVQNKAVSLQCNEEAVAQGHTECQVENEMCQQEAGSLPPQTILVLMKASQHRN